jgi:bifunctional UDP-N-acetylglucosamine pyrophosphorylase/glucosamine-1-phosphate N-acetyltransferase
MKAVILAAGKGTRMLPITMKKPKPLVKVAGKPFIEHLIGNLKSAGYKDIGMVVGYKKEMIEEFVKSSGLKCALIEQKEQIGTGSAVKVCEEFADGKEFIVVSGDNLYSAADLKKIGETKGNCVSVIKGDTTRYGAVVKDNGHLKEIVEKPEEYVSSLINVGLYKFTPRIFEALSRIKLSPRGELELTDAINLLAKDEKICVIELKDYWLDLAKPEDIYKVSEFILKSGRQSADLTEF